MKQSVWFNAWQYENEEHTIVPLIATILKEIEKKDIISDGIKSISSALRSIAYGFAMEAGAKVDGIVEIKGSLNGEKMISKYDELMKDSLLEKSLYFDAFDELKNVSKELKSTDKIIVFIDDLDRCMPHKAVKLLENIKLLLAQMGFVFVLGVAREVIEGYLKKRYEDDFGVDGRHGEAYLDKIVQIPIYIPTHHNSTEDLTKKMFAQINDNSLDDNLITILSIVAKQSEVINKLKKEDSIL